MPVYGPWNPFTETPIDFHFKKPNPPPVLKGTWTGFFVNFFGLSTGYGGPLYTGAGGSGVPGAGTWIGSQPSVDTIPGNWIDLPSSDVNPYPGPYGPGGWAWDTDSTGVVYTIFDGPAFEGPGTWTATITATQSSTYELFFTTIGRFGVRLVDYVTGAPIMACVANGWETTVVSGGGTATAGVTFKARVQILTDPTVINEGASIPKDPTKVVQNDLNATITLNFY